MRIMRRRSLSVLLLLLFVPAAGAWTWPVQGPVLQTFSFDPAHPYAAGQHRGIAIGADGGTPVLAPAAGVVSFAGTVPTNGKTITIQTASGLAVSLTHLGSITVARNASVDEGTAVGTVGPSGTAEFDVPYVHLGVRDAANDQGYLDPLAFLPVLAPPAPAPEPVPAPALAPAATPVTAVAPPEVAPPAAQPVEQPAPVIPAPQPVEATIATVVPAALAVQAPAAPVVPAAPAIEAPVVPAVPEVPVVEVPAPVAPTPALVPAAPAIGSLQAPPVASPGPVPAVAVAKPSAVGPPTLALVPPAALARPDAIQSSAASPALQPLRFPDLRHGPALSLVLRPLPTPRLLRRPATAPPSHGFVRVLPLGLAASLVAAAAIALLYLRRRRPPGPFVRLRAVHSAERGRLAA